jgi:poly(A) polymerase
VTPSEQKALRLIEILGAANVEARFVGGCVRDAVMGLPTGEIDLAAAATPDEVTAILQKAKVRVEPTGIAHGTITAVIEGTGIEITSLREDIETDGRHAKVTFTKDWEKDAKRRDFTLNSLSRDAKGKLHDYTGGWQDAKDRVIRFVGEPKDRIKEDYLRILRFFRFQATHGTALPAEEALKACHEAAAHLKDLSRERIWKELKKLLAAADPYPAFKMMSDAGVTHKILPEAEAYRLEKLVAVEKHLPDQARDPVLRLAALVHGEKTGAEVLEQRFALSKNETKNLGLLLDFSPEKPGLFEAKNVREMAYRYGADLAGKFLLLGSVLGAQFHWESVVKVLHKWEPISLPIKGDDLLALGVTPGPGMGELLREVEGWWIEADFAPNHTSCLEKAKELMKSGT